MPTLVSIRCPDCGRLVGEEVVKKYNKLDRENKRLIKERIKIGRYIADIQILLIKKALEE